MRNDPRTLDGLTEEQRAAVARFEAGEDIGKDAETVDLRVRKPLIRVVPIRMSDDQWRVLAREAEELGLRPTTMLRMWLLERLREVQRAAAASQPRPAPRSRTARAGEASVGAAGGGATVSGEAQRVPAATGTSTHSA